ncbi:MAG TPA: tRNA dihydrouridine synthase DusB [Myxococcota bacterium]|nr:tRNA dihydrouridine synthase DusB [Myxococcota bacterium]
MNIGALEIDPPVFLAPMAGVSDSPFRCIARRLGCPAVMTEMVSAEGISRAGRRTLELLAIQPEEHPVVAQLFGRHPDSLAEAARVCAGLGFDGIDINMGCPVKKVTRHGAGAALMRDPELARDLVAAVKRAVALPVSVKLRAGWNAAEKNVVEVGRMLAEAGADALTVHPRTRSQGYSGAADWEMISRTVAAVDVPVIGNGDLRVVEDGRRMLDQTGCAGIMLGRAALGDPWLPGAMARHVSTGQQGDYPPTEDKRFEVFCIHLQKMIDLLGSERRAVLRMRKHMAWYTRGLAGAAALRRKINRMEVAKDMTTSMGDILSAGKQERSASTCH